MALSAVFAKGFKLDGTDTRYSTSNAEFSDGPGDFFTRTNGSNIGTFHGVTGVSGSCYFAAIDTDGAPGTEASVSLQIDNTDILGVSDPGFSGLFAEDEATAPSRIGMRTRWSKWKSGSTT